MASRKLVLPAPFGADRKARPSIASSARVIGAEVGEDDAGQGRAHDDRRCAPLDAGIHPQRHQHVLDAGVAGIEHQGGRGGVGEAELGRLAADLAGDVQQIAGVEADLERSPS